MHYQFRVGAGNRFTTCLSQFRTQRLGGGNNAVVHQRHTVGRGMGVSIDLAGFAMGGPACMRDTKASVDWLSPLVFLQLCHLARVLVHAQVAIVIAQGYAR